MEILGTILGILPIVLVVGLIVFVLCTGYVKAPTNEAYIISGLAKEPRVLIGRAGIKIPFFERKDWMKIQQISIDIKTNGYVPTLDFIGVDIDAIAKVHVITERDVTVNEKGEWLPGIKGDDNTPRITHAMAVAAMKNFVNMGVDQIAAALTESLQGNMREIIGTQSLKQLCNDRKGFGDQVQEKAQKDMNALGIYIASCNIQKITDKEGLIIALGQDNMSKIQKDASIAKAQSDAEVAKAKAKADEEANEARIAADMAIEQQNHDFEMKKQQLKIEEDEKKAQADAAYEIQQEEQRKTIEINKVNADIAKQDKEIELRRKEAEAEEERLNATIRKKADAEKYAKEKAAEADLFERQRNAEAELFEEEKKAAAELAKAKADAEAELERAKGIKAVGEAEAAAIELRGLAEAKAMNEKAEAMKKYGQAALTEMVVGILPEMARAIAEPIASVDKISIIDSGNGNGANSMYSMVAGGLQQTIEAVKETTGLDLTEIMRANSYDAKVNRNVNLTGIGENPNVHAVIESTSEEV